MRTDALAIARPRVLLRPRLGLAFGVHPVPHEQVPAGRAGRVVEILAQDGQLVEHGQVLMRLEPR